MSVRFNLDSNVNNNQGPQAAPEADSHVEQATTAMATNAIALLANMQQPAQALAVQIEENDDGDDSDDELSPIPQRFQNLNSPRLSAASHPVVEVEDEADEEAMETPRAVNFAEGGHEVIGVSDGQDNTPEAPRGTVTPSPKDREEKIEDVRIRFENGRWINTNDEWN